jgi:hypothetical protein
MNNNNIISMDQLREVWIQWKILPYAGWKFWHGQYIGMYSHKSERSKIIVALVLLYDKFPFSPQ